MSGVRNGVRASAPARASILLALDDVAAARRRGKRTRTSALLGALVLLTTSALASDFLSGAPPKNPVRIDQRMGQQLPLDLNFTDETGKTVKLKNYFGKKPVIITPVYYSCPMLCNLVLDGTVKSLDEISFTAGNEFDVIAVSFDPRETHRLAAEKKAKYVRQYGRKGSQSGWHFLTGDRNSVSSLMTALGFRYRWDPNNQQWAHGTTIVVATPDGRIARYLFGINYAARDVKLALMEASGGKIGTLADQLVLLCYQYDAGTGRYTGAVMRAVRIGGGATVAAIASMIFIFLRRERRR